MNAEAWIAVGAALIAGVALYFNGRSTRAATRAARAAEEQTKIQQQLRVDAALPYVWVDVRPDDATGTLLNLVVGNSGRTVATNIRVRGGPTSTVDRPAQRAGRGGQARLANGLQSLAPGRTLIWPLGQGFNLVKDEGPQAYTFTIAADGPFGPVPPLSYVVDMSDWRGMLDRPAGSIHELTKAVRDLTKTISQS